MLSLIVGWIGLTVIFALGWIWSVRRTNAGIVDVLWAASLPMLVAWLAWTSSGGWERRLLLAVMVGLWGARLAWHLFRRMCREGHEDRRYAVLRAHWGERANRNFFFFFQAQAVANVLLALPFWLLMANLHTLLLWDLAGAVVVLVAVIGERIADDQLDAWKASPENRGKTCRAGLWAYSRHPNYFFEWLHWMAYPLMGGALFTAGLGAWWPATWIGPVVMLVLLLRGTGIPYTEKQALKSRGEDYRRYQREVSAFVPWFRKSNSPEKRIQK